MIKVGDIVKLKNPKKREARRRWRVLRFETPATTAEMNIKPLYEGGEDTTYNPMYYTTTGITEAYSITAGGVSAIARRLDTVTHRLERNNESNLVPISFWERIFKRY